MERGGAVAGSSGDRLHLVCNAHLDPVWLWEWEEGAAEALSTFRVAAEFCEAEDGFVFNHNEAILYQWIEEYDPALFERIRRLVRTGKWHVTGGWFLQPDCNMPSGEAMLRQIRAGRAYFRDRFGVEPRVAMNVDPFGHARGIVQLLAMHGYEGYLFCRPGQADCPLPDDLFRWIGFDGSAVLGIRAAGHYNSLRGEARTKAEAHLAGRPAGRPSILLWGIGNHGGGPSWEDQRALKDLIAERDIAIEHSTPDRFLDDLRASGVELPEHRGDLNRWAPGCYTSQVRIKQTYRRLENELSRTEKICATAAGNGVMAYPADDLAAAERDLLTAQFHDILPGSAIAAVEERAVQQMNHGLTRLERVRARAFFALAAGERPMRGGRIPILVFNPHPYPVETLVDCELNLPDQNWSETWTVPVVYAGARALATNLEQEASNLHLDWRKRVVFRAKLKPGVINRFDCHLQTRPGRPVPEMKPTGAHLRLGNDRLDVTINTRTGLLDRYAVDGVDLVKKRAGRLLVMRDSPDPWGAEVDAFRKRAGRFRLASGREAARICGVTAGALRPVRVIEDGPARTVVEATFGYERSVAHVQYAVPKTGTEVEVRFRVHWQEADRFLKWSLPTTMPEAAYRGEVVCGVQPLPDDGTEAVAQRWTAAVDEAAGRALAIVNTGTYGSDFRGGEIRVSLLRSPAYAALPVGRDPVVAQDRHLPRIDQGVRQFRFVLDGGTPRRILSGIGRTATTVNEPPVALSCNPAGEGTPCGPFLTLSDKTLCLQGITLAEDGRGWLVRVFNPTGRRRRAKLRMPALGHEYPLEAGPYQVCEVSVASPVA
jgi:alpha-mannosidase